MNIIVIGGGIAGVSAAACLAEAGANVTVLEAEDALGYHASGRSAAMFEENYGNQTIRALTRASRSALEAANVLSPRGLMMVALAQEEAAFEQDCADMDMTEIALSEAFRMVPILSPMVTRAATRNGAMDIDTHKLLMGFAARAKAQGATIVTRARVAGIEPGWRVVTPEAAYKADVILNAAGAWADQIAELAGVTPLGLQPYRRSMARLPAPAEHDVHRWPMLFGPGENWYAKPDAGGWIVSPADEDPIGPMDAWADDMVLAEGLARYEAHVAEPVLRVGATWAGLRTFAPDRSLVIGEATDAPGFFWLAGQGGYGFQTCAAAASHLTHLITGAPAVLDQDTASAVSPDRFMSA